MQIQGPSTSSTQHSPAFAMGVDTSHIIQKCANTKEARALPRGSVVGDLHGGLTFTDAVAAALEARSNGGWREIRAASGETWTIIFLDR